MFKKWLAVFSLILTIVKLQAQESFEVEAKGGYFTFTDSKMRDVYDKGGYLVGLSLTYPLCNIWKWYANVGFIHASGRSTNFNQKTSLWQIPLDLGLKPTFSICNNLEWFFAAGPRFFYAAQKNHSDYVSKRLSNFGVGLFVNSGLNFFLNCNFHITLFGEYSYQPRKASSIKNRTYNGTKQLGGLSIGGGLGYTF